MADVADSKHKHGAVDSTRISGAETAFDYQAAPWPIPEATAAAYRHAWSGIANPGSWWSGEEHVAIAATVRAAAVCRLCNKRSDALSPNAVTGKHDGPQTLPAQWVDAIHRIRTDPARLSGSWVDALTSGERGQGHYVEMVGIITVVLCIDTFHEVLGLPLEPLPRPEPGNPDRYTPPGALRDIAWVPMISPGDLGERERDIYFGAPEMGNVIRALSLVPDAVRMLNRLSAVQYVPTPDVRDMTATGALSLSRPQVELLAARTSALNNCFY